ncbi:pentapeptide repeat-containing protein (plasmid) [Ralstonia sp. 25C]|uniref:pentapeptide repeat-containing protein n=1 Tax=Ralstonia sp. 25C TaxID=3447363 RepID=UPI003F74EFE9
MEALPKTNRAHLAIIFLHVNLIDLPLKMNEILVSAIPLLVPAVFFGIFLYVLSLGPAQNIPGVDKRAAKRLYRAGVRWHTPEELAIQYLPNKHLWSVVDRGYTDGRGAQLAQVLRWHTPAGAAARQAVTNAILTASQMARAQCHAKIQAGNHNVHVAVDLQTVSFVHNGTTQLVHDLQTLIPTGQQLSGQANLIGIPLTELTADLVILGNACFAQATFRRCNLGQVVFQNCSFVRATFDSCRLGQVRFVNASVSGVDFANSRMNAMQFDDVSVPGAIKFNAITYAQVVKFVWECIRYKDGRYFAPTSWFDPISVDVHGLTRHDNAPFRDYVRWCEVNLGRFRSDTNIEKKVPIFPVIAAVTTKFWSSFSALFLTIAITISLFSALFITLNEQFGIGEKATACAIFDLIEFSFKTFVNSGFSDVKPLRPLARVLTMAEAMLGYLSLGALIFLLNKRIESMRSS